MKKPITKKGSSLVLVLMVMSILFIIGTAILSLSVMSYKNRESEETIKYNLYASEAGLDEAYAILSKYTEKAFEEANEAVEEYVDEVMSQIEDEREKIEILNFETSDQIINDIKDDSTNNTYNIIKNYSIDDIQYNIKYVIDGKSIKYADIEGLTDLEHIVYTDIVYVDIDGILKEEKKKEIEDNKKLEFKSAYKNYFTKKLTDKDINNLDKLTVDLKNKGNYSIFKDGTTGGIDILSCEENFNSQNNLEIKIKSNFEKDNIKKAVQLTYILNVPEYNNTSYMPDVYTKIYRNPVWTKAICADGNMDIKAGKVNITAGDVYIKGKDNDGGIILTKQAGEFISQNGNVSTAENIKISDDCLSIPKVDIEKNVYARNIIIDDDSEKDLKEVSKGANISIGNMEEKKGTVYLLDDLEMNEKNSNIEIGGGFYGLSDGSENAESDHSSSIIINADDIGNGSSLKINNGLYILGTAYIKDLQYYDNPYKYQTGESISIRGKYKAYTVALTKDEFKDMTFERFEPLTLVSEKTLNNSENIIASVKYYSQYNKTLGKYDVKTYITVKLTQKENNPFSEAVQYEIEGQEKIVLGYPTAIDRFIDHTKDTINITLYNNNSEALKFEEAQLANQLKNVELHKLTLNVVEKSKYFKSYYDENSEEVTGISIEKKDNNAHAGIIFTGDNISSIEETHIPNEITEDIKSKTKDLKSHMFYMGNVGDKNPTEEELFRILSPVVSVNSEINFNSAAFSKVSNYNSNGSVNFINLNGHAGQNIQLSNTNDIIVLNNNENIACVLGNKGFNDHSANDIDELSTAVKIKKSDFNGIIITKGNVYIDGSINFKGTIITDKDIIFIGSGEKNIQYHKQYVENVISKNYEYFENIFKQYAPNKYIKIQSYDNVFQIKQQKTIEMKNWVVVK